MFVTYKPVRTSIAAISSRILYFHGSLSFILQVCMSRVLINTYLLISIFQSWSHIENCLQIYILENVPGLPGGTAVKNLPANAGDTRDPSSIPGLGRFPWSRRWQLTPAILAWKIPWTEEPSGLQSMGLQSQTQLSTYTHIRCWNLQPTE